MRILTTNETLKITGGLGPDQFTEILNEYFGGGFELNEYRFTEFNDASLGLPEPGYCYAQVITPGAIVQGALNGESITVHFARSGYFKVKP